MMQTVAGETMALVIDGDYVDDPLSDVKCILSLRKETVQNP